MSKERWQDLGACRPPWVDKSNFYPEGTTDERNAQEARAKAVCAGCPVRQKCLDTAVALGEKYGVWGGTGERERAKLITP